MEVSEFSRVEWESTTVSSGAGYAKSCTQRVRTSLRKAVVIMSATALAMAVTLVGTEAFVESTSAAVVKTCSAANSYSWAAAEGAGTAGTTYYELEISNVGRTTCTLRGWARVWAVNVSGDRIGKPASYQGVASTVTLAPGATAHVVLGVEDTGAVCGSLGVKSTGLRVVPPGESLPSPPGETDEVENFPLVVCPNQPSMHVLAVHAGTGIPLHTFS